MHRFLSFLVLRAPTMDATGFHARRREDRVRISVELDFDAYIDFHLPFRTLVCIASLRGDRMAFMRVLSKLNLLLMASDQQRSNSGALDYMPL